MEIRRASWIVSCELPSTQKRCFNTLRYSSLVHVKEPLDSGGCFHSQALEIKKTRELDCWGCLHVQALVIKKTRKVWQRIKPLWFGPKAVNNVIQNATGVIQNASAVIRNVARQHEGPEDASQLTASRTCY
jgi:hypothetical protein